MGLKGAVFKMNPKVLLGLLVGLMFLPQVFGAYCNNEVVFNSQSTLNNSYDGDHTIISTTIGGYDGYIHDQVTTGSCGRMWVYPEGIPNEVDDLTGHTSAKMWIRVYLDNYSTTLVDYYESVFVVDDFYPITPQYWDLVNGTHTYIVEYVGYMIGGTTHYDTNITKTYTISYNPPYPTITTNLPTIAELVGESFDVQVVATEPSYGIDFVTVFVYADSDGCGSVNEYEGYVMSNPSGDYYVRSYSLLDDAIVGGELVDGNSYYVCVYAVGNNGAVTYDETQVVYSGGMIISGFLQDFDTGVGVQGAYVTVETDGYNQTPLSYWNLDEGTGVIIGDSAGDNDGVKSGANWVDGQYGKALDFDGVNDYSLIPYDSTLGQTDSFSISAWVKPESVNSYMGILTREYGASNRIYAFYMDTNGKLRACVTNTAGSWDACRIGGTTLSTDTWQHVGFVYNSVDQELHVYLDGDQDDASLSGAVPATIRNDVTKDVHIGYFDASSYYFNGTIDEVKFFASELTNTSMEQLANGSSPYFYEYLWTAVNGYFEFDGLGEGLYTLTFQKSDYNTDSETLSLPPSSTGEIYTFQKANDSGHLIHWIGNGTIYARLVDPSGVLIDTTNEQCSIMCTHYGTPLYNQRTPTGESHTEWIFTNVSENYNYTVFGGCTMHHITDPIQNVSSGDMVTIISSSSTRYMVDFLVTNQNGNPYYNSEITLSTDGVSTTYRCTTDFYGRCSVKAYGGGYLVYVKSGNHYAFTQSLSIVGDLIGNDEVVIPIEAIIEQSGLPELKDSELKSQFRQQIYFLFTIVMMVAIITLFKKL